MGSSTTMADNFPTMCFETCNNAYTAALIVGKSPALCSPSGDFARNLDRCYACQGLNAGTVALQPINDKLKEMQRFIDYCRYRLSTERSTSDTSTSTSKTISLESRSPTSSSWVPTKSIILESAPADDNVSSTKGATPNNVWIAGPIVGSFAFAFTIIGLAGYVFRRKRKNIMIEPDNKWDKSELHSEGITRRSLQELDGRQLPTEVHSQCVPPEPEELDGNARSEMLDIRH